jgi:adenine deaminase
MKISGKLVDIHTRDIYPADIWIENSVIQKIERVDSSPELFILPGLIDSHIHVESSMITPGAFALAAVRHGTVGVVSDPHEIANVLGKSGVIFMIRDAEKVPLYFWFGAPSCVPATVFETSGAALDANETAILLGMKEIKYLSEMMNFPGVIYDDKNVLKKIEAARKLNKPIDGHAPGLSGDKLIKYVRAGISTDHECSTIEEAREKIELGMKILIREGSAARNLEALKNLFTSDPDRIMLCSDDLHPEMLKERHINRLIADLITEGYDIFNVIRSATINPVQHYGLEAGLLKAGDSADFILVDSLYEMNILETWIKGIKVFGDGETNFIYDPPVPVNKFNCRPLKIDDVKVLRKEGLIRVIEASEGELLTKEFRWQPLHSEEIAPDLGNDILKIVVKDRYNDSPAVTGFIKGIGLKKGAFASSIAHDSHNIIAVGTNDSDIINAINEIVRLKGGLAVASGENVKSLQLNIGGIMTTRLCGEVAVDYQNLTEAVKTMGCQMKAPFMTLSFMALLVIPDLKIGDKGLFDVGKFELVPLFVVPPQAH